MYVVYGMLFNV